MQDHITYWNVLKGNPDIVQTLRREFKCSEVIANVLATRGFTSKENTKDFFQPDLTCLHDPYLMKDMNCAVERILENIKSNVPILVFGDYDVDGTTGTALLYIALKKIGGIVHTYIPNREKEGYGLSKDGILHAKNTGANLLITCDCGINANEQIQFAAENGIEVIVTDHHMPDDDNLPDALAILNPKQRACNYPFKGLCGCGVAFKLAVALIKALGMSLEEIYPLLELVTLGTIADMMPILDENRVIVSAGLRRMEFTKNLGLRHLLEQSGLGGKSPSVVQLVFGVAPKINAAGRLGDANRSVTLLTTEDDSVAMEHADVLFSENNLRKDIQNSVVEEALRMVNASVNLKKDRAIILPGHGWHPGVVGIVASKIKEEFHRPAIVISIDENGVGKGSARSIPGFDLYTALTKTSEYLEGYGGHPMAAGLTVLESKLDAFRQAFVTYASKILKEKDLIPTITLDGEMKLKDINTRFMNFLDKLAPYGPGNMRPKFAVRGVDVVGNPRIIGNGNHLRFRVRKRQTTFDAIGFNMSHYYEKLIKGFPVDLAFVVELNEWQGQSNLQLNIRDIKLTGREK